MQFSLEVKKSGLILKAIKLAFITGCANLVAFLVPIYVANVYGVSKETDDFFLSYGIITFIGIIFSGSVRAVSIPFLQKLLPNKEEFELFISSILKYTYIFIGSISLGLFLIAMLIWSLNSNNMMWYLAIFAPIILLTFISSFFYAILNTLNQFYLAELSPLSRAIVIFITIYILEPYIGIKAVVIGYLLGEIIKLIHLFWIIKIKNNINFSLRHARYSVIKDFVKNGSYQIISSSLSSATPLVNKLIASTLMIGSISILDYGDRLFMIFNVLLNSFLTLLLPSWSRDHLNSDFSIKSIKKPMLSILFVSILALIAIYLYRYNIIDLLYPKVEASNKNLIAYILLINMIGLVFNSQNQIINRAIIAIKATKIMIVTSTIRLIITVVIGFLFSKIWGIMGIAYSIVLNHLIAFPINYYFFLKALRDKKS